MRSRFARQIALATLVAGGLVAVGHLLGGMIGWWHAYEITFGGHKTDQPVTTRPQPAQALSIVVLPLVDDSRGEAATWFADALTADLTLRLSAMAGVLVISRDTASTFKGQAADARRVAQELGVRHVVQGDVVRGGEGLRLRLSLVDGESGLQRWSEQSNLDRAQLGAALDEMASRLARELNVQMIRWAGARNAAALDSEQQKADDIAMRGWAAYLRGFTRENLREALDLFEQAVSQDPKAVRAWGGVAVATGVGIGLGWLSDRDAALRRLEHATERLQALDANHWYTWLAKSNLANVRRDYESSLSIADVMLERFPSQPQPNFNRGLALLNLGRFDECVEPTLRALRIGPRDALVGVWQWQIATCYFMREQYRDATDYARAARQSSPNLPLPPLTLAAALARSGQAEEGRRIVAEYRQRNPSFEAAQVERYMRSSEPRYAAGRQRLIGSLQDLGMP